MFSEEIVFQTDGNGRKKQKYIKKQKIGSGGFAKCYLFINTRTNEKLAAKVIDSKEASDKSSRNKIVQEVEIHKEMDHKNIVKFYDMFEFEGEIFLVMELCQNNSLKEFLKTRVRITEFQAKCYLHQIIAGLEYIHEKNIVHRDIKLGNLFLNYKMEVKIGDFGLSTRLKNAKERKFTTCGTPNYIAPEILKQTGHSFEADIWALGIILFAMLCGKPPFESQSVENTYKKIKSNTYQFPKQVPLSNEVKLLIKGILDPNPKTRMTLEQIKNHDFLNRESQKIPRIMPSYTISIPPQSNYLKQYVSEKSMKLLIYPKRVNEKKLSIADYAERDSKLEKLSRVLSADKKIVKKINDVNQQYKDMSTLNKGRYIKAMRALSLSKDSKNSKIVVSMPKTDRKVLTSPAKYEQDTTEIICYFDMSQKYGVGYLLSNGSCGVIFNDSTSLTKVQIQKQARIGNYLYYNGNEKILEKIPEPLNKKLQILKICEKRLNSYRQNHIFITYYSKVHARKWVKFGSCFVIKLSNSILQFFWDSDSITVRGYKWIKWRINDEEGEAALSQKNFPAATLEKVEEVRAFLIKQSIKKKSKQ